jgi:hypothetical protein
MDTKFQYLGKTWDLFEDKILSPENFLAAEDNDEKVNIVLKQGIIEICKFFGFREHGSRLLVCSDTQDFGSVIGLEVTMIRPKNNDNEGIEDRLFSSDGEVNGSNHKPFGPDSSTYPIAVCRKRAKSRAVLGEIGISAYGEDEAPSFSKAVYGRKKYPFKKTENAKPMPEDPAKSPQSKDSPKAAAVSPDNNERQAAQKRIQDLKEYAETIGLKSTDAVNSLKLALNLGGTEMVTLDKLINNSEVFKTAKQKLEEMKEVA